MVNGFDPDASKGVVLATHLCPCVHDALCCRSWRSISRQFVLTRTPTQVASHAQKYFLRLSSGRREKRRASIHDMHLDENISAQSCVPAH